MKTISINTKKVEERILKVIANFDEEIKNMNLEERTYKYAELAGRIEAICEIEISMRRDSK